MFKLLWRIVVALESIASDLGKIRESQDRLRMMSESAQEKGQVMAKQLADSMLNQIQTMGGKNNGDKLAHRL